MRKDQLLRSSPIDIWLLKEYKKFRIPMPKDEDSLFKAIAQQICPSQNFYERVKTKTLEYFNENRVESETNFESLPERDKMMVISNAYHRNLLLFKKCGTPPEVVGRFAGTKQQVAVRLTEDGFYEAILPIQFMEAAAYCQSVVYEVLYERVFGFSKAEITDTVSNVRHKRYNHVTNGSGNPHLVSLSGNTSSSSDEPEPPSASSSPSKQEDWSEEPEAEETNTYPSSYPKFPFRVAKSLDPDFYRNAQFDLWLDCKKESQHMIKPGDKVSVKKEGSDDIVYKGHVQDVPENGPVCVFVEELGKKISVEKELLTKITVPKAITPIRSRTIGRKQVPQKPMMRPAFNDSWSDEKVGSSPDSGSSQSATQNHYTPTFNRQRRNTMSSLSPPMRNYNHGSSPPLRYGTAHPIPAWNSGYYHGPVHGPQSPQSISMMYQTDQMLTVVNPQSAPSYMPPPPPPLPSNLKTQGQVNHPPDYSRYDVPPAPLGPIQYRAQHPQHPSPFIPPSAHPAPPPVHVPQQPYPTQFHPSQLGIVPYQQYFYYGVPPCQDPNYYYDTNSYNDYPQNGIAAAPVPSDGDQLDSTKPVGSLSAATPNPVCPLPVPYLQTMNVSNINFQAMPSQDWQGQDLPWAEIDTLRFFYNIGCEWYSSCTRGTASETAVAEPPNALEFPYTAGYATSTHAPTPPSTPTQIK